MCLALFFVNLEGNNKKSNGCHKLWLVKHTSEHIVRVFIHSTVHSIYTQICVLIINKCSYVTVRPILKKIDFPLRNFLIHFKDSFLQLAS